jgi:hypothetical protein
MTGGRQGLGISRVSLASHRIDGSLSAGLQAACGQFTAASPREQHDRAERPGKPRKRCNKRRARIGMALNFFRCEPLNRMFK